MTFRLPGKRKYPSIDLGYAAGRAGGTMTGVISAANEKAVEMFIEEKYVFFYLFLFSILLHDISQLFQGVFFRLSKLYYIRHSDIS